MLAEEGPPLTYFRAAMVVGAGSESYRTLRYLVQRLPVMVAPSWLRTRDPADRDRRGGRVPAAGAGGRPSPRAARSRSAGPDVLSYAEMLDRMALVMGKAPPGRSSRCR